MGKRTIRKFFENFRGLDLRSSDLTRPDNFALTATNIEIGRPFDIRSRKGYRPAGQVILGSNGALEKLSYPQCGLFEHQYFNSTTGGGLAEFLGCGGYLYKQQAGTMSLTYGGGGTATFETYISAGTWFANLKINGVAQAGFPMSLEDGATYPLTVTFETLRTAINAVAGFTCVLTPWAKVNGNQTGAGVGTPTVPITVFAGHTITVSTSTPTRLDVEDRTAVTGGRICRDVIAQTATTITLKAPINFGDIDVNNNDVFGVGLYQPALLGYIEPTTITGVATVFSFPYWEAIYVSRNESTFIDQILNTNSYIPEFYNYALVNKSNICYIAPKYPVNGQDFSLRKYSGLLKYDGYSVYGADLPPATINSLTLAAGAGLSTGDYKYLVVYQHIDGRGNVSLSADNRSSYDNTPGIDPKRYQDPKITTTAGNNQVTVVIRNPQSFTLFPCPYRKYAYAIVNGIQAFGAGSATINVTAGHWFRVGDTACFLDRTLGYIVRYPITAVANATITFTATNAGSVNNADIVSCNMTAKLYRTKVGGNVFYLNAELPVRGDVATATLTYLDTVADSALKEQYEDPGDFTRDPPPVCTHLTVHQGLLVGGGVPTIAAQQQVVEPNTIYWSNPGEDNSWTISSNALDVASGPNDSISVTVSDTENMLAVFTPQTYTNVAGDLASNAFTVDTTTIGDVGCPAPGSIQKIRDTIFFCSLKGFRALKAGQFLPIEDRLVTRFQNIFYRQLGNPAISTADQTKIYLRRATSVHDTENQRYICYIPAETKAFNGYAAPNDNSRCFVYDYANDLWGEWKTGASGSQQFNAWGGISSFNKIIYFNATQLFSTTLYSTTFVLNNYGTIRDYADNVNPIFVQIQPQWEINADPSIPHQMGQVKLWALNNIIPNNIFSWRIQTYLDFDLSGTETDFTLTFTGGYPPYKTGKAKLGQAPATLFDFSSYTIHTCPLITGYEYILNDNYKHDNFAEVR